MAALADISQWETVEFYERGGLNKFSLEQVDGDMVIESETVRPEGPKAMSYGVIATRERNFAPHLKGTNIFEVDFVEYSNNGEYINKYMTKLGNAGDREDPVFGLYLMGWCITIGNIQRLAGGIDDAERNRAVQFHFDHRSKITESVMNRQISREDLKAFPKFKRPEDVVRYWEDIAAGRRQPSPYRSRNDSTILFARQYGIDESGAGDLAGIGKRSWGHRYGVMLSDDGNTFSWMLDGKVMDTHDITGYFSSSTDDFANGAYVTLGGGGSYRKNLWRFRNPCVRIVE